MHFSSFLLSNDNHFHYLDMGKTRIQTHVYSKFSSLLLIIDSDNKRPEVQLTTELACKLICHRKCWSNSQWQVTRNVCLRLALMQSSNHMFACSKQFIQLEMKFLQYFYIHYLRLRPSFLRPHILCTLHTKTFGNRYQPVFMGTWLEGSLLYLTNFIPFHLMQILYLVGVGLLLNVDLACTDSQGMLYYNAKV